MGHWGERVDRGLLIWLLIVVLAAFGKNACSADTNVLTEDRFRRTFDDEK